MSRTNQTLEEAELAIVCAVDAKLVPIPCLHFSQAGFVLLQRSLWKAPNLKHLTEHPRPDWLSSEAS